MEFGLGNNEMGFMKNITIISYLIFGILVSFYQNSNAINLHQAQEILLSENPDLTILKLEVEKANSQIEETRASFYPSIDAVSNYSYTSETPKLRLDLPFPAPGGTHIDRELGDHDKMEFGIDATYPIFTGFSRGQNIKAKNAGLAMKTAQWQGAKNQMSLKLGSLYYAWQLASAQAKFQEKVLSYSQDLEKQMQSFVRAGTAVRSRALAAEAKAKATEVELLAAQNTRDSLALEVVEFLGAKDLTTNPSLELSEDTTLAPQPDWNTINSVQKNRPETEVFIQGMEQMEHSIQAMKGQKYPQLYGIAGLRYANPGLDLSGDSFMTYGLVGLQLKWNLFDGFKNSSQRKQLEYTAQELAEQKRKLIQDFYKTSISAKLQYTRWAAQYEAAMASRNAAEAAAKDLKHQFEVGVATGLEWLDARNNQAKAELSMEQARTMQRIALMQWDYANGKELRF